VHDMAGKGWELLNSLVGLCVFGAKEGPNLHAMHTTHLPPPVLPHMPLHVHKTPCTPTEPIMAAACA